MNGIKKEAGQYRGYPSLGSQPFPGRSLKEPPRPSSELELHLIVKTLSTWIELISLSSDFIVSNKR
jgi:hypothetical protein